VLSAVKSEFLRFADILNKTKIKLDQASKVIGDAEVRTRSIQRKLKNVETLTEIDNDNADEIQELFESTVK
jgi:DNA recombination protein RmuC